MKAKKSIGWVWEGMEDLGPYENATQEQASADLESWIIHEAKRIGGGKLPAENLDVLYDPDYTWLQIRRVGGRNELHIGIFGLRLGNFYQEDFRKGISHELAHLSLGETESIPYSDEFIKRELRADLKSIGTIRSGALVNLTRGISEKFKMRLDNAWDDVSNVARDSFRVSPQVLGKARQDLGLSD